MSTINYGSRTDPDLTKYQINHIAISIWRPLFFAPILYNYSYDTRDMPYLPPFSVIIEDIVSVDDIYHL